MVTKRFYVGMSGGVDSSVAALLLKMRGHQVNGFFMVNWDTFLNQEVLSSKRQHHCAAVLDYQDALQVGQQIKVDVQKISFIERYWKSVFQDFIAQLKIGYTPNPDVLCNQLIKFGAFFNYLETTQTADSWTLAMGHYARTFQHPVTKKYFLLRALDLEKDQTYFLSRMNQHMLQQTIFPVGALVKDMVRRIADQVGLPVSQKADSTGICFIGERQFKLFLKNYLPEQPGWIVNAETGQRVGRHEGCAFYTIGQRRHLNLGGQAEPCYVVAKNMKTRTLYVAGRTHKSKWLCSNRAQLKSVNLISGDYRPRTLAVQVQFRYQQPPLSAQVIIRHRREVWINYDYSEGVTPGQEAVFYQGMICLGGGQVAAVFLDDSPRHLLV